MKRCITSLTIRKMKVKATIRSLQRARRIAKIKGTGKPGSMVYTFNPSLRVMGSRGERVSVNSRAAWSTQQGRGLPGLCRASASKRTNKCYLGFRQLELNPRHSLWETSQSLRKVKQLPQDTAVLVGRKMCVLYKLLCEHSCSLFLMAPKCTQPNRLLTDDKQNVLSLC